MKYFFYSILFLGCCSLGSNCSKDPGELNQPAQQSDAVSFTVTKNNVTADNYSYAELTVISKRKAGSNDAIVLTADKGVFANNSSVYTISAGASDTTHAYLKYNKTDIVKVSANLFGLYSREVIVSFTTAFPSQILISPDSSSLIPLFISKSLVTARLLRTNGTVTTGLAINFYDSTAKGAIKSVGTFLNFSPSNDQGNSTVQYWLQDTSYHGLVYIKGFIQSDTGRVVGVGRILIQ